MKITWLGHACFKISTDTESIVLDPYQDGKVDGLAPLREKANLVLCSHEHGDHNAREVIELEEKEITMKITTLDTYHDDKQGTLRGKNRIHILEDGSYKVAHLGDLGCALTQEEQVALKNVDALMIPIGGFFTIDATQAKEIVDQILPKVVLPMHYRSDSFGYGVLGTVDSFTKLFENVVYSKENTVDLKEISQPTVVVLSL